MRVAFLLVLLSIYACFANETGLEFLNYDRCPEDPAEFLTRLIPQENICTVVEHPEHLGMMEQTMVYKCYDAPTYTAKKYWLVHLDMCYVIRYDEIKMEVYYTETKSSFYFIGLIVLVLMSLYWHLRRKK